MICTPRTSVEIGRPIEKRIANPGRLNSISVMPSRLKNKWVVITGASSGFGASAAPLFGVEGAKGVLGARRLDRLKGVAVEAKEAGASEAHVHQIDVSSTESVE